MNIDKRYSLQEANHLLPQVKAELSALQQLALELESKYSEYRRRSAQHDASDRDALFELEGSLEFLQMELNLHLQNFSRQGILLKMIQPGLVDFPGIVDGKEVLLCWKEGEESITHYHGWEDGFAGRKLHPDA